MTYSYIQSLVERLPWFVFFYVRVVAIQVIWLAVDTFMHPPLWTQVRGPFVKGTVVVVYPLMLLLVRLGLPYFILHVYRRRRQANHMNDAVMTIPRDRHQIYERFVSLVHAADPRGSVNVQTIFFPDVGQDHTDVASYTGGLNAMNDSVECIKHTESAYIIPRPVSALLPAEVDTARLLNFSDVGLNSHADEVSSWRKLRSLWETRFDQLVRYFASGKIYIDVEWVLAAKSRPLWQGKESARQVSSIVKLVAKDQATYKGTTKIGYVLHGVGRGAVAVIRAICEMTPDQRRQIKGLVLESAAPVYPALNHSPLSRFIASWGVAEPEAHVNTAADKALDLLTKLEAETLKHLRVLLVNSRGDTTMRKYRTQELTAAFQRACGGSENVVSLMLRESRRGHFFHDSATDVIQYEMAAMDFYESLIK
jgi:hypothetical protein